MARPKPAAPVANEDETMEVDAAAAEAARAAALENAKKAIVRAQTALDGAEKRAASVTRDAWVTLGDALLNARRQFTSPDGGLNKKEFGKWISGNGFGEAVTNRNARSAAIWLAEVKQSRGAMFQLLTDPTVGAGARGSAITIQRWLTDAEAAMFGAVLAFKSDLLSSEDGEPITTGEANKRLGDTLNSTDMEAVKMEGGFSLATMRAVYAASVPEDIGLRFLAYKPPVAKTKFADLDIDDAAKRVIALIASHKAPGDLWEAISEKVAEGALSPEDEDAEEVAEDGDDGFSDDAETDESLDDSDGWEDEQEEDEEK